MVDAKLQTADFKPLEERLHRARSFSSAMLEWVNGRGGIVIVVHDNPDPDCLASALALCHLFREIISEEPIIAFSGMIGRSENLIMAGVLEIHIVPLEIVDLSKYSVVCMLDTQPLTGNNSLDPTVQVDIVIDHHPLREASNRCRWVDVKEDYGVTATILYEYLIANGINIDAKLATAIFYAIKSDTQDLGREANLPDREAYLNLFPLVDKQLLYQITNPNQPIEYFRAIRRTLAHARIYGSAVVADMERVVFPELVAEMADFLLRLEDVEAVLTFGEYSRELVLSLRTSSADMNAGEMVKRLVKGIGVGGGHGLVAGGKVVPLPDGSVATQDVEKILTDRFLDELGLSNVTPRSIDY
jgi:nanoRNase/pAp phosphatase (c-di-AMP/oligoRNAs hydrolase)